MSVLASIAAAATLAAPADGPSAVLRVVSFKIGEDVHARLEQLAAKDDRTVSALIRLAVLAYLSERAA